MIVATFFRNLVLNVLRVAVGTLICSLSFPGLALPISVSQSIDKSQVAFEDSVQFEIVIEWDGPQSAYRFGRPLTPYIDRLHIGRFSSSITSTGSDENEKTLKRFDYTLLPTSSGAGKIDQITISYFSWPDSIPGELITEPVEITIADAVVVAESDSFPFWILIIGSVVFLGSGSAVWFVVKRRSSHSKELVRSPVEVALEDLTLLKDDSGSDLKKFQTGVYDILSRFLKSEHEITVAGCPEDKLGEMLLSAGLDEQRQNQLKGWLVRAEQDKFRPVAASPGETIRLETEIRRFLENLKV